jgi:hypothetical protein
MYGVGENPVYAKRLKQRLSRKESRAKVAAAEEERRRALLIGGMFDHELREDVPGPFEEGLEAQAPLAEYGEVAIPSGVIPEGRPDGAAIPRGVEAAAATPPPLGLSQRQPVRAPAWEAAGDHGGEESAPMQPQAADAGGRAAAETGGGLNLLRDESSVWNSIFAEEEEALAEQATLQADVGRKADERRGTTRRLDGMLIPEAGGGTDERSKQGGG